ncbi:hypothetical protein SB2_12155 [Methylobacterium radiotolerans]|nr:hypothetical protein SB3_06740 [Methylobacterium radiotolerans]KTS47945.1 hypothetical protein SB2_12155 [Methylobacterium radiotolerans]
MAGRIRAFDWASTPLGPISRWPQSLRTIVDLMLGSPSMMSLVWGPEAIHIYNDSFTELLQEHRSQALGRSAYETFARSRNVFDADVAAGMAGRSARLLAQRYPVLRQGQLADAWFDVDYAPIRDEARAVAGVLWILKETTVQQLAEQALRASETRHRLLIESWTQAEWEADADGVVIADSPSWRAYTGQTVEEWLDYGWLGAVHPDDRACAERQWRKTIAARGLVNAEFRLRAPDGKWRWTNVLATPVIDAGGAIEKWAGLNIDIDARKRAEAALRESEERFRGLIEGFGQFSWEASADGLIEVDSPGWRAFTGQSVDEWIGWGWINAIHPDDRDGTGTKWRQAVATRTAVDHEYRLWHAPSASWRWSNVRVVPITTPDGSIRKWSGVNIDVTDHHKLLARQEVLINELQHRSRNLLSVVTAVADRTVKRGGSIEAFEERLQALGRAQALLSKAGSDTIEVGALIRAELAAYANEATARLTVSGPEVHLRARQVQNFALAVHELTTNAVKYGALKVETAGLAVTWEIILDRRERQRLALDWVESGVAIDPEQTTRRGYGTELIEEALAYAMGAKVDYALSADGVRCRIEMPLA